MKQAGFFLILMIFSIHALCQDDNTHKQDHFIGKVYEVYPGDDYKAILKSLKPGEQLVFHEGIYKGPMIIHVSGSLDYPVIIKGYGNGEERPEILFKRPPMTNFPDSNEAAIRVYGNHLILDYLKIKSEKSYGLRIGSPDFGCNNVTIKNCIFDQCGLGDLSANFVNVSYDNIRVLNNLFNGSKRTSVYIGNHEGKSPVTHFTFKGNVIDGSQNDGPETTVGYGIELKLNVTRSMIENNFIAGTKGPGIMVYGSQNTDKVYSNVVRNNIIIGSRKEAGIVVGGGPSVVQNNVVIHCKRGIFIQNYAHRNLMDHVVLTGNTVINSVDYGISYGNVKDIIARNNLAIEKPGTNPFMNNPNKGMNNKSRRISKSLETLMIKIKNRIPGMTHLKEIWRHVSSGPLSESQLKDLMNLILIGSRPAFVSH